MCSVISAKYVLSFCDKRLFKYNLFALFYLPRVVLGLFILVLSLLGFSVLACFIPFNISPVRTPYRF